MRVAWHYWVQADGCIRVQLYVRDHWNANIRYFKTWPELLTHFGGPMHDVGLFIHNEGQRQFKIIRRYS